MLVFHQVVFACCSISPRLPCAREGPSIAGLLRPSDRLRDAPGRRQGARECYGFDMAVSEEDIGLFNDSLQRCYGKSGFIDRFYSLFLASSDEVAKKFQYTDFKRQRHLLASSLYFMMAASYGKPEGDLHIRRIADLHSRHKLDIRPELYDLWLDCLVRAASEYDSGFDASTERVWRIIMGQGIALMKSHY
jgi:hemoglobin-like flavoprotein